MFHFVISCALLTLIGAFVKSLHGAASPIFILGFRSLFHLATLWPRRSLAWDRPLLSRAICAFGGMLLYFFSLQMNPLLIATAFFWISPVFNQGLMERKLRLRLLAPLALVLAFVLLNASTLGTITAGGLIVGFFSSILIGASYYFLGKAGLSHGPEAVEVSFATWMSLLSLPGLLLKSPGLDVWIQPRFILILLAIGIAASLYQRSIVRAYQTLRPSTSAQAQAVWIPLLSLAMDVVFFNSRYTPLSMLFLSGSLLLLGLENQVLVLVVRSRAVGVGWLHAWTQSGRPRKSD